VDGTEKPNVGDLSTAAQKLKFTIEVDKQSKYPRSTWDDAGLVLIDTKGQKKSVVLHKLAPEVKLARATRLEQAKLKKVKKKNKKKQQNIDMLKQKIAQRQAKKK
jgi:signal recognition particle subunit SEC65